MGMRRSALALMLFAFGLFSPQVGRAASVSVSWDAGAITTSVDDRGWLHVDIPSGARAAQPGDPDLPRVSVTVPVGLGESVTGWTWIPDEARVYATDVVLAPAPELRPSSAGGPRETEPSRIYASATAYPTEAVQYMGTQTGRGQTSAVFSISPFSWNPRTRTLELVEGGTLQVETSHQPRTDVLAPSLRSSANEWTLQTNGVSRSSQGHPSGRVLYSLSGGLRVPDAPTVAGTPVEFLVIAPEALASGFDRLLEWKNRTGSPSTLRTTEWIYENYPHGADNAEKIRLFVRDAYQYWGTQTVLLGGDPGVLPIRYSRDFSWNSPEGTYIATDYYYACLDGTWNADGDDSYGEASVRSGTDAWLNEISDLVDLRPEVHVGRIPANDLAQLELYMDKYMAYVKAPASGDYLSRVLTMGEVLFEPNWVEGDCDVCSTCPNPGPPCASRDGATDCQEVIQTLTGTGVGPGLTFVEMYERDYWWVDRGSPDVLDLNLADVLDQLNQGVSVAFHSGHGDRDRWSIGRDRVTASSLAGLTNAASDDRYIGMVYAINCNSAAVDFDCAAEAFMFAPQGGGMTYIGSTNLDFPSVAQTMQRSFFTKWPGDGSTIPGDAYYAVMDSVGEALGDAENQYRFLINSLTYLGDPDMVVWTTDPQEMQVSYDNTLEVGAQDVTVSVTSGGAALEGAKVTFYKDGDALAAGLTDASGAIALPFAPKSPGTAQVTVTHHRGRPFEGTATVGTSTSGPYLSLDSFTISDTGLTGNGNGRLEIGETVLVDLTYTNHGNATAAAPTVTLAETGSTSLIEIEIGDAEETLASIDAGATATATAAFEVTASVPAGLRRPEEIDRETLELQLTWNDGTEHSETIAPNAYRSDFVLFQSHFTELSGNGDGDFDAGDQFEASFDILNLGSGTASGVVLEVYGTGITVVSTNFVPVDEIPQYEVGSTATVRFNVTAVTPSVGVRLLDGRRFPRQELFNRAVNAEAPETPGNLTARGFQDHVNLKWLAPSTQNDLYGYRIYRSDTEDGVYETVGLGIIERTSADADTGYYADEGLPSLTKFFYKLSALDRSGNESGLSEPIGVNTAPGFVPGWPVLLDEANGNAPTIAQLNFGDFELIFGTDVLYAFTALGEDYYDGDGSPSTRGRLTSLDDGFRYQSKPAVADLDADGEPDIVSASWFINDDPEENRQVYITAVDRRGNVMWKQFLTGSPVISAPAIGDIDNDGAPEVVILGSRFVYAFNGEDGSRVGGGSALKEMTDANLIYGSVALADIDGSPGDEILYATRHTDFNGFFWVIDGSGDDLDGFPFSFGNAGSTSDETNSSPAVANLDDDPQLEVVVASRKRLWMFNPDPADSDPTLGWSAEIGQSNIDYPNSSPAVGDLDRDGNLEVAVGGSNGRLYVFDAASGDAVPAFTQSPSQPYLQVTGINTNMGSPILGDLTGDGNPEILIGDASGLVHAYEYTGVAAPGFPYVHGGQIGPGLAVWDVDKDGHPNLVIQSNQIQSVVVLDFPNVVFDSTDDAELAARYPWPMFRHDQRNTGVLTAGDPALPILLGAPELSSAGGLEIEMAWVAGLGYEQFRIYRRVQDVETWDVLGTYPASELLSEDGAYRMRDLVASEGLYLYRIGGVESDGTETLSPERSIEVSTSAQAFRLHPARPNPFRPFTNLRLDLPKSAMARVQIVDPAGRVVRTLLDREVAAGTHNLTWDGRSDDGRDLGAGVYFVTASARGVGESAHKLIYLK